MPGQIAGQPHGMLAATQRGVSTFVPSESANHGLPPQSGLHLNAALFPHQQLQQGTYGGGGGTANGYAPSITSQVSGPQHGVQQGGFVSTSQFTNGAAAFGQPHNAAVSSNTNNGYGGGGSGGSGGGGGGGMQSFNGANTNFAQHPYPNQAGLSSPSFTAPQQSYQPTNSQTNFNGAGNHVGSSILIDQYFVKRNL
ncbi:unnamed protein product [Toxocara canis]|uniref:Uncharacterized protein n=1 Tax=Toxocara canis TaxID=6265 RepID=A0A183UJS2_TOXCA|nr:unnamed protein product [Toxocara canis]